MRREPRLCPRSVLQFSLARLAVLQLIHLPLLFKSFVSMLRFDFLFAFDLRFFLVFRNLKNLRQVIDALARPVVEQGIVFLLLDDAKRNEQRRHRVFALCISMFRRIFMWIFEHFELSESALQPRRLLFIRFERRPPKSRLFIVLVGFCF